VPLTGPGPRAERVRRLEKGLSSTLTSLVVSALIAAGALVLGLLSGNGLVLALSLFGGMLTAASWGAYLVLSALLDVEAAPVPTDD
jgi:uncharacterized membrane protein